MKIVSKKQMATKKRAKSMIARANKTTPQNSITAKQLETFEKISNRVAEEMNELGKELTKAKRFGLDAVHKKSGESYVKRILDEASDVEAIIAALRKVMKPAIAQQKKNKKKNGKSKK